MSKKKNLKKISGEVNLTVIELGLDCRKYLQWYYAVGGGNAAFGDFKGKIVLMNKRGILFKRLYIDFFEMDGTYVKGKEDHIWIFDKEPFIKVGIKAKDCVSFTGKAYAYKRQNNSIDFSLKECEDIKKIEQYSLPDKNFLKIQSIKRFVCEMCLYNEYCYGFCIAPDNWKESIITFIKSTIQ